MIYVAVAFVCGTCTAIAFLVGYGMGRDANRRTLTKGDAL